jgi:uncharacterized protein (DUF433 family)
MDLHRYTLIGLGLYTVPEASRLTNVSSQRIRRWLKGYSFKVAGERRSSGAVWTPELPEIDEKIAVSFLDLMEIRFVSAFLDIGVSWPTVRLAASRAKDLFGQTHPFSTKRFRTDGKTIFAELLDEHAEPALLDLVKTQYAFRRVVKPSLYAGLDFTHHDTVLRWWPMGRQKSVLIDPARAFGQPIVKASNIPTALLASAYKAEGSYDRVATWYNVAEKAVRDAVQYERKLAA